MQDEFDRKILIRQNLCLAAKIAELRTEINNLQGSLKSNQSTSEQLNENEGLRSQIQKLKNQNILLKQRITLLHRYQAASIQQVISQQQNLCYCGGLQLNYYTQKWENKQLNQIQSQSVQVYPQQLQSIQALSNSYQPRIQNESSFIVENQKLKEIVSKLQKKVAECRLNHKFTSSTFMNSAVYAELKNQCKNLLLFCSQSITKQRNLQAYIEKIEQQRKKQIIELLKKFQFNPQKIKCEDFIMKSELPKKLENVGQKIQELLSNLQEFKKNVKKCTQNQVSSYGSSTKYTQKLTGDSIYEKATIKNIHNIIEDWMADNSFTNYLQYKNYSVNKVRKQWGDYVRNLRLLYDQNQEIIKQIYYQQQLLQRLKPKKYIQRHIEKYEGVLDQLTQNFEVIKEELLDAEFRLGKTNVEAFFKYRKQMNKRIELQESIQAMKQKMPLYSQLVNFSQNLNNVIQTEKLQIKEKEGKYLFQIESMKNELQEKKKMMSHYEDMYKKKYQQTNRLKLQFDKLTQIKQSTDPNQCSQNQMRLQMQVNELLKKISCICGRGHEANVILNCRHIFCKPCVQSLVKVRKRQCPLCRQKFSESNILHFKYN